MKKLEVDQNKCIGCGACVSYAPEYFDFNDEGLSEAKTQESLDSEEVEQAIEVCPVGAISLEEKPE